jgi:hypothetical protein
MIIGKDLLDSKVFDVICKKVIDHPWRFIEYTANQDVNEAPSFVINISDEQNIYTSLYEILTIPLITACSKHNINLNKILRIRAGLHIKQEKNEVHLPHIDQDMPHTGMIYYLNNSDGDTFFYNERYQTGAEKGYLTDFSNTTIEKSVTPEKNKYVIFNWDQFHSSSSPSKNPYRVVINYNFI